MIKYDFIGGFFGECTWCFRNKNTGEVLIESGKNHEAALNKLITNCSEFNKDDYELMGNLKEISKLD